MGLKLAFWAFCFLIAFSLAGTAATIWLRVEAGVVAPVSAAALIVTGAVVVGLEVRSWRLLAAIVVLSAASEGLGLVTGIPFGRYEYTDRWAPTVAFGDLRFPLLLPLAWVVVLGGSFAWACRRWNGWRAAVAGAALATFIDWPMERAMTDVFGYWRWLDPRPPFGAPLSNALGWFATGLLILLPFHQLKPAYPARRSPQALGLFCLFVAASGGMRFFEGAWTLLGGIGLLLISDSKMDDRRDADHRPGLP